MKRLLCILLAVLLLMVFTACNTAKTKTAAPLTEVNSLYDQYGNLIQQTLYNEATEEYFLKEFMYTYQNKKWVCTDQRLTLLSAAPTKDTTQEVPALKIFHTTDITRKPVVLVDNDKVRVTLTDCHDAELWYMFAYEIRVDNKSNQVITMSIENCAIMGIGCPPLFSIDHIEPGRTAYFTLGWDPETLERFYIPYIDNVEFMIRILDNSNWNMPAYAGERVLIKHN